ncbi:MAG: calcium-binding protein, partial [Methylovulum sp.]
AYVINAGDLLQGFSDVDGDTLAINGLTADNGNLLDNNNGTWTFTPNANYNGPVNLVYNVIDGQGGLLAAGQNFNLAAVNDAPAGAVNITGLPVEGQTLSADAGKVQDADGLGAFSYQWQSNGQAVAGAIGSSYLLGAGDVGKSISVLVSYTDGGNTMESLVSLETSAVSAQIQQDAPVANNDSVVTPEEKPVKVSAVANDTDANNDMLAISAFDATSANGGSIVLNTDGSLTYMPAHDFSGTDSFTYRVSDGSAESNTATVSVTVLDDASVESRVSIILSDSEINLELKGKANISGTGNAWDNKLVGNKGDNVLNGKGGNDHLKGEEGKDVLIGGIGNDVLKGGDGKDSYLYAGEDIQAGGKDKILDGQGDVIDLKALLSSVKVDGVNLESIVQNISLGNAFSNVADHETTLAFNGDGGKLLFDINQDGKFTAADDFQITITGVEKVVFNAGADLMLLV